MIRKLSGLCGFARFMVAPLAQSVEHSHGKAGVAGSIPARGSLERAWRDSSVGQSARLIIVRSRVRVPVPLPLKQSKEIFLG